MTHLRAAATHGLVLVVAASGGACAASQTLPTPWARSRSAAAAGLSGVWLLTVRTNEGVEVVTRMTLESRDARRWQAYSRPGALRPVLGGRRYLLARMLGKLPPHGSLAQMSGTAEWRGEEKIVQGTLTSALGRFYLAGTVVRGRLVAELRRDSLGPAAGSIGGTRAPDDQPVRDYRTLAANIRRALADSIYDPGLLDRPEWKGFVQQLDASLAAARDDADALLGFYAARPRLRMSHLHLLRYPEPSGLSLDSLLRRISAPPDSLVSLAFPAPGVAYLRVRRWVRVLSAVDRAFVRIDSAAAHTLVMDIRGNPGGDVTSIAPVTHLTRDSMPAGVFLGHRWYRSHRAPPTPAEAARLPSLSRADGASLVDMVREHGAVTGIVPPREPYFAGTVYLLTSRRTGSASEALAHLLKATGRVTLVGERTAGAILSAPTHSLGDGWILILP
ncbi:MAG: S41 family peptidase, partial [Gemmatimonadaceae bacterium]